MSTSNELLNKFLPMSIINRLLEMEKNDIHYQDLCKELKCKFFKDMDFLNSNYTVPECKLVEIQPEFNIIKYPDNCPYYKELTLFKIQEEKRIVWENLNDRKRNYNR